MIVSTEQSINSIKYITTYNLRSGQITVLNRRQNGIPMYWVGCPQYL